MFEKILKVFIMLIECERDTFFMSLSLSVDLFCFSWVCVFRALWVWHHVDVCGCVSPSGESGSDVTSALFRREFEIELKCIQNVQEVFFPLALYNTLWLLQFGTF